MQSSQQVEMLDDSFDESSVRQMAGLERSLSSSVAGNIGHRTSGQDIYQLTYQSGKLTLQDLHIGARVVDLSWEWEFRAGNNYTGSGEKKPVVWILVAKNHYSGLSSHATLLAEELIGKFTFDNSKRLLSLEAGVNRWGESGKKDASLGLRPWLNSKSTHSGQGFYIGFSANFKRAVLTTNLPNREWEKGGAYSTSDYVFLPSTTELGDTLQRYTYQIGTAYPYFEGSVNARRSAQLNGEVWWYWTRSPDSSHGAYERCVLYAGTLYGDLVGISTGGVRPVLNLKSETLVSEIRD